MIKESSLKVVDIAVASIIPNENNANEMSESSFNRLVEEIRDMGFLVPIHVVPYGDRYKILNGEHRWRAATALGYEYVPSVLHSDEKFNDPDIFELVNVKINNIRGTLNTAKFFPLWKKVVDKYGIEDAQKVFAIDNSSWKKVNTAMVKNLKNLGLGDQVQKELEKEAAKKDMTPDKLAKQITKVLNKRNEQTNTSCIVFTNGGTESLIVHLNEANHAAIKKIIQHSLSSGIQIDELIGGSLTEVANDIIHSETTVDVNAGLVVEEIRPL